MNTKQNKTVLRWVTWAKPSKLNFLPMGSQKTHSRTFTYAFEPYILKHLWCLILFSLPVLIIIISTIEEPRAHMKYSDRHEPRRASASPDHWNFTSHIKGNKQNYCKTDTLLYHFHEHTRTASCQTLSYSDVSLKNCLRYIFIFYILQNILHIFT